MAGNATFREKGSNSSVRSEISLTDRTTFPLVLVYFRGHMTDGRTLFLLRRVLIGSLVTVSINQIVYERKSTLNAVANFMKHDEIENLGH